MRCSNWLREGWPTRRSARTCRSASDHQAPPLERVRKAWRFQEGGKSRGGRATPSSRSPGLPRASERLRVCRRFGRTKLGGCADVGSSSPRSVGHNTTDERIGEWPVSLQVRQRRRRTRWPRTRFAAATDCGCTLEIGASRTAPSFSSSTAGRRATSVDQAGQGQPGGTVSDGQVRHSAVTGFRRRRRAPATTTTRIVG